MASQEGLDFRGGRFDDADFSGARLHGPNFEGTRITDGWYRLAASVLVITLSIGIALVNPNAAKYFWLLLAVAPRIADQWSRRQSVKHISA